MICRYIIIVGFLCCCLLSCREQRCEVEHIEVLRDLSGGQTVVAYTHLCEASIGSEEYANVSVIKPGSNIHKDKGNVVCQAKTSYVHIEKKAQDTVLVFLLSDDERYMEIKETKVSGITFLYSFLR